MLSAAKHLHAPRARPFAGAQGDRDVAPTSVRLISSMTIIVPSADVSAIAPCAPIYIFSQLRFIALSL
jgi:hypothetical protein